MTTRVAIIGSHGLYARYGGWDQLVNNLAERKASDTRYLIFNSSDTPHDGRRLDGVVVRRLVLKASGWQGLFYDFWSILVSWWTVDVLLLLGVQGIPLVPLLRLFRRVTIVANVGGIEWERPKFGRLSRLYLRTCFRLSFTHADYVVLDNPHYKIFMPRQRSATVVVLPYGGEIDGSLEVTDALAKKYPFIRGEYYLSVSRALEDNRTAELCEAFRGSAAMLVLISNFSSSPYGKRVFQQYQDCPNIVLIDGLYDKPELDLIRRRCKAYVHTHTLCGTAPSLVEMVVAQRPILSIDIPQNRYTLHGQGHFFSSFDELRAFIEGTPDVDSLIPSAEVRALYGWDRVVSDYESLFAGDPDPALLSQ